MTVVHGGVWIGSGDCGPHVTLSFLSQPLRTVSQPPNESPRDILGHEEALLHIIVIALRIRPDSIDVSNLPPVLPLRSIPPLSNTCCRRDRQGSVVKYN